MTLKFVFKNVTTSSNYSVHPNLFEFRSFSHILNIQQRRMKLFMILCSLILVSALPSRIRENLLKNFNDDVGHRHSHSSRSYERYRYRNRQRYRRPYSPYNAYESYDPYGTFDYQYGNEYMMTTAPFPFNLFG